jgi:hypothetical protein
MVSWRGFFVRGCGCRRADLQERQVAANAQSGDLLALDESLREVGSAGTRSGTNSTSLTYASVRVDGAGGA